MPLRLPPALAEAARLVRAGRFAGAIAALGRLLRRSPPPAAPVPAETPARPPDAAPLSYTGAAGTRTYTLHRPARPPGGGPLPLVLMLHGCTQSPDDFATGTRMNALADEFGVILAYPAQAKPANDRLCWNWFDPEGHRRDGGETELLAGIIRRVMADHPVDPRRVYAAGLSAGGAAAANLAALYPDLLAAVAIHSGLPFGAARGVPAALFAMRQGSTAAAAPETGRRVPAIVFHGDADKVVHPRNGEAVVAATLAGADGVTATVEPGQVPGGRAYSRTLHRDGAGRLLCEHWTVHGAGHAWAGGSPEGSFTDPAGPDASRAILRFFLANPRPADG
ncbi:extracellular catalytic domain type 1 short-chain-length polyhydroxyalkanoate depolymerase [Azospirillum halopraeferens]|uniref:extracellular catalytic domain type 1 short-chain-length polyhydroxyalkanoate depolymerase n=1 Tax=Azospirillum halopraeferens TaxID=34010 RepID=UPI00041B8EF5|nr:PHB depolymerase family esterase [Azospirillum halopraeferens]